jgi:hypothetical protein
MSEATTITKERVNEILKAAQKAGPCWMDNLQKPMFDDEIAAERSKA